MMKETFGLSEIYGEAAPISFLEIVLDILYGPARQTGRLGGWLLMMFMPDCNARRILCFENIKISQTDHWHTTRILPRAFIVADLSSAILPEIQRRSAY